MTGSNKPSIYDIGYEKRDNEELVDLLKAQHIELLIDIRQRAQSRKKGFSKSALQAYLNENGIEYIHLKELGTPKDLRDEYKVKLDLVALLDGYRAYLDGHPEFIKEVTVLANNHKSALFCYEREMTQCHRSVLLDKLGMEFSPIHL